MFLLEKKQNMRNSLNCALLAQVCAKLCAHNRIIPLSLMVCIIQSNLQNSTWSHHEESQLTVIV